MAATLIVGIAVRYIVDVGATSIVETVVLCSVEMGVILLTEKDALYLMGMDVTCGWRIRTDPHTTFFPVS